MKRLLAAASFILLSSCLYAQAVQQRLAKAVDKLLADSQMRYAILGCSVVKSETGEKIFEMNARTGLAPASCQKLITSATILDMLGPAYRYQTLLGYDGVLSGGLLKGNLYLSGSGDPSLGSWRFSSTTEAAMQKEWGNALKNAGVRKIDGRFVAVNGKWDGNILPGGWIWDDMGNYYGAGVAALNWHENQYDLTLRSGRQPGDVVTIVAAKPRPAGVALMSELRTAARGTGDNAYIYLAPGGKVGVVRGTIPAGESAFQISGSLPDPPAQALGFVKNILDSMHIPVKDTRVSNAVDTPAYRLLHRYLSPSLDSLTYWFLKRSINLYGESFLRTIAYEQTGRGLPDKGLQLLKSFWQQHGIHPAALHMMDGSGLSPQNRVTAEALVTVLQYARSRRWFRYYYDALPEYNQMKLKSGTIGGAKSFAGYHTARDGTTYTVAIIINNYDGSASSIVKKMFAVLDELK